MRAVGWDILAIHLPGLDIGLPALTLLASKSLTQHESSHVSNLSVGQLKTTLLLCENHSDMLP